MTYDPMWRLDFERSADDWHRDIEAAYQRSGPSEGRRAGPEMRRALAEAMAEAEVRDYPPGALYRGDLLSGASKEHRRAMRAAMRELGYELQLSKHTRLTVWRILPIAEERDGPTVGEAGDA